MRLPVLSLICVLAACEGPAGPAGPAGPEGDAGATGSQGSQGSQGSAGQPPPAPWLTQPGVKIAVQSLTFDSAGAHVQFSLADSKGTPLDRAGVLTDTPVAVSFVLARLATNTDGSAGQYTAYTTRTVSKQYPTPDSSVTATQATTESVAANFETIDVTQGTYRYTFAAALTGLDSASTQTVLAVAVRGTSIDRAMLSARPDQGAPIKREVVTAAACNSCHGTFAMHGGRYTSADQCVMCHQPQSSDPDSGNTVDFKVMVHKIHQGSSLTFLPYVIYGFQGSVNDWSNVEFPESSAANSISNCKMCHAANAAEPDRWATEPSKATCTSCHDNIEFDTTTPTPPLVLHSGGTQSDTSQCNVCHPQTGGLAGIFDKHYVGTLAPGATQVRFAIQSVTGTAGQAPLVTFSVTVNGAPITNLTAAGPLTRLTATIAGPNSDEAFAYQARIVGASSLAPANLTAVDAPNGVYQYQFPDSGCTNVVADGQFFGSPSTFSCLLPAAASYRVGLEGFMQATGGPRFAAPNVTMVFPTGAPDRRQIVALAKCNGCHSSLAAHGGSRNDPQYCTMCHNTTLENVRTTLLQGNSFLGFTLDFRSMIHKIHRGENLANGYVIGNSNFSDVAYPRSTTDCAACHTSKNWTLPLPDTYAWSQQQLFTCTDSPVTPGATCSTQPTATATVAQTPSIFQSLPPQTSVCTSCHDADYTLAHAQLNTTPAGVEACAACHGSGMAFDVATFHGFP